MSGHFEKDSKLSTTELIERKDSKIFKKIKEHRGTYFVEYKPASTNDPFAYLQLVFLNQVKLSEVVKLMEFECSKWLQRFPVTLMVTAFDDTESILRLTGERNCDHLFGFLENGKNAYRWSEKFSASPQHQDHLEKDYHDMPFTSGGQGREQIRRHASSMKKLKIIIAIWLLFTPMALAISGVIGLSYLWVSIIIIIISFARDIFPVLKKLGYLPKSDKEKQKEVEDLEMRHYHYHCKLNPDGFRRLKNENFDREAKARTRKEADEIIRKQAKSQIDDE